MKPDLIFTIVTKNYLPLSNILGDSIKMNHPDSDYVVIVADHMGNDDLSTIINHDFLSVNVLGISNILSMTFKYNLTEFCTALKPKCFEYLLSLGYQKIVYLDPDIYVYSSLESIFNDLNNFSICITPHLLYPEIPYTGFWAQGAILASGVYNLGFIGLKNSENSKSFLSWWAQNLEDFCFIEKSEGLFTDQKWLDFCPVFFPDIIIYRELGVNVALWNIHERIIDYSNGEYFVKRRDGVDNSTLSKLKFVHFSNFNFTRAKDFEQFIPFTLDVYSDFIPLVDFYRNKLIEYDFIRICRSYKYEYNFFCNGVSVNKIHRRLYRKLLESNYIFDNPFSVEINSFYMLLKKNKLVTNTDVNIDVIDDKGDTGFSNKFELIKFFSKFLIRIMGIKRYTFLCRFSLWFFKYENQIFLLKEFESKIEIKKPSPYINLK